MFTSFNGLTIQVLFQPCGHNPGEGHAPKLLQKSRRSLLSQTLSAIDNRIIGGSTSGKVAKN